MAVQALNGGAHDRGHLYGDVPVLLIVAIVFTVVTPRRSTVPLGLGWSLIDRQAKWSGTPLADARSNAIGQPSGEQQLSGSRYTFLQVARAHGLQRRSVTFDLADWVSLTDVGRR